MAAEEGEKNEVDSRADARTSVHDVPHIFLDAALSTGDSQLEQQAAQESEPQL